MNIQEKRDAIRAIIESTHGKVFTITFYKKTSLKEGKLEERVLNGRTGVTKHLRGGESTLAGKEDVVGIFDMHSSYRAIWLDGVKSVSSNGVTMDFDVFPESIKNLQSTVDI